MGSTPVPSLLYALWPILTLAVVCLWIAAMLDIVVHRRAGSYTLAGLSCVAAAVSVAAVVTIVGIGVVFSGQSDGTPTLSGPRAGEQAGAARNRTLIFSFGLEHAFRPKPDMPADDGAATGAR